MFKTGRDNATATYLVSCLGGGSNLVVDGVCVHYLQINVSACRVPGHLHQPVVVASPSSSGREFLQLYSVGIVSRTESATLKHTPNATEMSCV